MERQRCWRERDRRRLEGAQSPLPQSPHQPPNAAVQPDTGALQARLRREQRRKMGVIGTVTEINIPVVTTKLVSVFGTRLLTLSALV